MNQDGILIPASHRRVLSNERQAAERLRDWRKLLSWSDLLEGSPTRDDLIAQVSGIGRNRGLRILTAMQAITIRDGVTGLETQIALAREFVATASVLRTPVLDLVAKGRVLFAEEQIAILASYLIQHGAVIEPDETLVIDSLLKSILIVNELFGQEQINLHRSSKQQLELQRCGAHDLESFLPVELRAAAMDSEPLDQLIARLYTFVNWARAQDHTLKGYCC
jgi:hypothetical protein